MAQSAGSSSLQLILGGVVALVVVALLLAERSRLARVVAEESAARKAAETRALAADLAKTEFMASMSHEIRTPINAVIGMTELLLRENLAPSLTEKLAVVDTSAHALLALVEDLLDLSRIDAGQLRLRPEDFRLGTLLEEVVRICSPRAAAKGIRLEVEVAPGTLDTLHGDAARLRQVLLNLTSNAIKFTSEGMVRISARIEGGGTEGAALRFEVADTGIGIAPRLRARLFEPFVQADTVEAPRVGAGLGLAISKKLVEKMDGEIGVESKVGSGSLFWFRVPVAAASGPMPEPSTDLPVFAPDLRILIVEDNPVNRRVMVGQLSALGIDAATAEDGHGALEALASGHYSAVLMDVQLPGLDGYEATRRWRELEAKKGQGQRLVVIAVTAHAVEGERERCLAAGMDDFLPKPFRLTELGKVLVRWLPTLGQSLKMVAKVAALPGVSRGHLSRERIEELQALGKRTGRDLLGSLAGLFRESGEEHLAELKRAFAAQDADAARRAAHTLKSSAGNIGAFEVAELARSIEEAGREQVLGQANDALKRLETLLPQTIEELEQVAGLISAART